MPLDDLIPIGGASKGNASSKRGGSSDLTSGLISISSARDNVDVDMDDFDVGDLLGDGSSKSKSKSKDKDKSDDKKKKKSKDKEKSKSSSSSSSSKKKSKSSKSKKSAFDDDDDDFGNDDAGDEWTSSAKNWDSAAELEMAAAAAARRKNGGGKMGGGFDDEFSKMLGLDSGANFESPPLSPEPVTGLNRDDDDTFGMSDYTPTVRGSKKLDAPAPVEEPSKVENDGISASFFQDDGKGDGDLSSLSSFLGPTSDRRGGGRGGRRQAGGADSDPFGFGSTTTPSTSTFDSLFGGSGRRNNLDDPFAKATKDPLEDQDSRLKAPIEELKTDQVRDEPPRDSFSTRDAAPATQRLSAKDDLLADLFSSEPRSSARGGRRQEQSSFSKRDELDDDYDKKTSVEKPPELTPTLLPVAVDPAKQQNDLLAELFATPSSSRTAAYDNPKVEEEPPKPKPAVVEMKPTTPPKATTQVQETPSALPTEISNTDLASARDSLLMDLLGGLSPPKPNEPLLSRRRSRSANSSNNSSPEKEVGKAEDPFKSSLPPSPTQSQPLPTVPEVPAEPSVAAVVVSDRPVTPPSPGRRRSLTMDKGSLAIRESDFEQSKDSLLEEILPSSPSVSARSSPHRRNSYSQSFEAEESVVADVAEEPGDEIVQEKKPPVAASPPASEASVTVAPIVKSPPPQAESTVEPEVRAPTPEPPPPQPTKGTERHEPQVILAPACNCDEREAKITAAFDLERAALQQQIYELTQQLDAQAASSSQLTQQLTQQLEERDASMNQLSQQLEARGAANAQLAQQLAAAERDKVEADQRAATSKDDATSFQHRAELLEAELRGLREELSRSKRAVQDAELALARKIAEQDEADQLERHREKRALEALSAQMQRALARLTVSHQVQEEGSGYDNSAARVAAEDEARLRVIASLEGSSKRAAQHAEQERTKLTELLRELEAGARNARQGALEDKERLRQEQQRLDALSAHLQAQTAALRDQEAAHAAYMGKQLAEAREDARVYEARLATRRTQLERDERALYEARAEFAAFREQTALEIEREHEELRGSRLALEDAWRELRADREDLEAELASHEDEFQALESMRQEVQQAEARLAERTQEVVALAEKLDAGTRELLEREQLVAQQAAVVQDTDTSFSNRERALERVKHELETREQRLHVQIRQLDGARLRLTQQRREQQQLMAAARRQYTTEKPTKVVVDNNKLWRQTSVAPFSSNNSSYSPLHGETKFKAQPWEVEQPIKDEDPSGLPPALRKQVEANWLRRNQQARQISNQYRHRSSRTFDPHDFDTEPLSWSTRTLDLEKANKPSNVSSASKVNNTSRQSNDVPVPRQSVDSFKAPQQQRSHSTPTPATSFHTPQAGIPVSHSATGSRQPPPPPSMRSLGTFQPTLRVNL